MGEQHVVDLIEAAMTNSLIRERLANDRTSAELAETATKEGYGITGEEAQKILAGAYLTSDECSAEERQQIMGGLAWDYLDKVEERLDRDFSLLKNRDSWERALDFYENVYQ